MGELSFNLDALKIAVHLNDLHFAEIPFTVGRIVSVDARANHHTQKAEKIIKIIRSQVLRHYMNLSGSKFSMNVVELHQYADVIAARYDALNQLLKCYSP